MSLYSLHIPAATSGTLHDATSGSFTNFVAGTPLNLSFELITTRASGSQQETLTVQILWSDKTGTALTPFTVNLTIDATATSLQKFKVTPPTGAVSGVCYIKIVPAADPIQHDVWVKNLRLGKTEIAATNGAQLGSNVTDSNGNYLGDTDVKNSAVGSYAAIGDQNRVRFSLWERGFTGVNLPVDTTAGLSTLFNLGTSASGVPYIQCNPGVFTANSQAIGMGTNQAVINIPINGSENLFASSFVQCSGLPAGGAWALVIGWIDKNNIEIGSRYQIAAGGNQVLSRVGGFIPASAVPALACNAFLRLMAYNGTGGAASVIFSWGQPMVCSAGANQTAWPAFNPGPSGDYGATVGAKAGTNLYNPDGSVIQNADNTNTAPNLVFNGSLRLVNSSNVPLGWSLNPGFAWTNNENSQQLFLGTQTNATLTAASDLIPVTPNTVYTLQAELATWGLTSGSWYIDTLWYSQPDGSAQCATGYDGPNVMGPANGSGFTLASGTVTSPPDAKSCLVRLVLGAGTITGGSSVAARRIKLAKTASVTAFSDDATNSSALLTRAGTGIPVGAIWVDVNGKLQGLTTGSNTIVDNTLVPVGTNLVVNSEMFAMGDNITWGAANPINFQNYGIGAGYASGTLDSGRATLADGSYAYYITTTNTSAPLASGPYVDILGTRPSDSVYQIPVKPGDTLAISALAAGTGISGAYVEVQYQNETFAYAGEQGGDLTPITDIGAAAYNTISRSQMTKLSAIIPIPADGSLVAGKNIRWARIHVRSLINAANMRAITAAPFLAIIPTGQKTVPAYTPGPGDRLATPGAVSGVNLKNSGGTLLGDGDVVNQFGVNALQNSDFSSAGNKDYGWSGAWAGNVTGGTTSWGVNLNSSYSGQLNVAWAHVDNTPHPGSSGQIFDGYTNMPAGAAWNVENFKRYGLPVYDGDRLFASVLMAAHRCQGSIYVQYFDGQGNVFNSDNQDLQSPYGGRQGGAGNGDPANFDRLTVFGNVPAGARYAIVRTRGVTQQGSTDVDSWMFYTQMMLCKVPAGMTTPPRYNPGVLSNAPALTYPGSGARLGDSRNIPPIQAAGARYYYDQAPSYSAPTAGTPATSTISLPAGNLNIGSAVITYNAMSVNVTGTNGQSSTYYLYVDDGTFAGGTQTLQATTDSTVPFKNDGRINLGSCTITYPTSGTGTPGTGTGGGGRGATCVAAISWVFTKRGWILARDVVPGDYVQVLDQETMDRVRWERVTNNQIAARKGWEITTIDGEACLHLSEETPLTLRDQTGILPCQLMGQELPTMIHGEFAWKPCVAQPLGREIEVCLISCGSNVYAAGIEQGRMILTHNVTYSPKP